MTKRLAPLPRCASHVIVLDLVTCTSCRTVVFRDEARRLPGAGSVVCDWCSAVVAVEGLREDIEANPHRVSAVDVAANPYRVKVSA